MNRPFSIALLAVGIMLIAFGINASNSISSDFSRLFSGSPTNKAVWLLIGGTATSLVSLAGLARGTSN